MRDVETQYKSHGWHSMCATRMTSLFPCLGRQLFHVFVRDREYARTWLQQTQQCWNLCWECLNDLIRTTCTQPRTLTKRQCMWPHNLCGYIPCVRLGRHWIYDFVQNNLIWLNTRSLHFCNYIHHLQQTRKQHTRSTFKSFSKYRNVFRFVIDDHNH